MEENEKYGLLKSVANVSLESHKEGYKLKWNINKTNAFV